MKILEYRPGFGTLSSGMEKIGKNEVVDAIFIEKDANYGYNSIHKQWFSYALDPIATYKPKESIDLAIFNPIFGEKVSRVGASNFFFYDFQNCLTFLENNKPDFAIFQTEIDIIPHVNTAENYVRDGFGQLSKDKIIDNLQQMDYKAHLLVLDEADFGIPLHRSFAFYIATPKDFELSMPKGLFTATGRGDYRKYRTVEDAISDLGKYGDWVEYISDAQNDYQRSLRNTKEGKVTWNHLPKIKSNAKKKIASIKQGSNNSTPKPSARSKGYNRAKWGAVCRCMDEKFYLSSSKGGDSIHPKENRPFTIREGCRIHGLPDKLSFDLRVKRAAVAKLIHNSVSPIIGEMFGELLK